MGKVEAMAIGEEGERQEAKGYCSLRWRWEWARRQSYGVEHGPATDPPRARGDGSGLAPTSSSIEKEMLLPSPCQEATGVHLRSQQEEEGCHGHGADDGILSTCFCGGGMMI